MFGVDGSFKLEVRVNDVAYPVGEGRLRRLRLHEMLTYVSPMAELYLQDRANFLVEMMGMTGTESIVVDISDPNDERQSHTFRVFRAVASRAGSESHLVKLYLISEPCMGMFAPARFKSYPGSTLASVARNIADDLSLDSDVEETDSETHDLFCPGWSYAQFLRWLADRARSKKYGTAGYLYFVDLDNKLRFFSPERAKSQTPVVSVVKKDMRSPENYEESDLEQGPYRAYMNPLLLGGQGMWGITSTYFGFEDDVFVESPQTPDGSPGPVSGSSGFTKFRRDSVLGTNLRGLADNLSILLKDIDPASVILDQGLASSEKEASLLKAEREARILRTANSAVKASVLIGGDLRVRAGDLINLQIGSTIPENSENQTFSGAWIVERVTHQLVPQYVTQALLFRTGVSGAQNVKLAVPPGGVA